MDAFRLAKEATLRALDSPMQGRPEVVTPPSPAGAESSDSSRDNGFSVLPGSEKRGCGWLKSKRVPVEESMVT